MYYAITQDNEYLETGYNSQSRFEMKEQILLLLQPNVSKNELQKLCRKSIEDICKTKGWTLVPSVNKFPSTEPEKPKKWRVVAEVTTYCYLDVEAMDYWEALRIAKQTDGGDYYTMDNDERPGSFDILEINPIVH